MSGEAAPWLRYAAENYRAARILFDAGLLNPALQNSQQAVEKSLKAVRVHRGMGVRRTHSIRDLNRDLIAAGCDVGLAEDDSELLDSIYTGSRYPGDSVFAEFPSDMAVAATCLDIARRTLDVAQRIIDAGEKSG